MLMLEFDKWRKDPYNRSTLGNEESEENFSLFFQLHYLGENFMHILAEMAYQVYELQVVVDGLIEDMEKIYED